MPAAVLCWLCWLFSSLLPTPAAHANPDIMTRFLESYLIQVPFNPHSFHLFLAADPTLVTVSFPSFH